MKNIIEILKAQLPKNNNYILLDDVKINTTKNTKFLIIPFKPLVEYSIKDVEKIIGDINFVCQQNKINLKLFGIQQTINETIDIEFIIL